MSQIAKPEIATLPRPARPNPHRASQRVRFFLAAGLFLAWISWLAYLAATTTHPLVLSRPQFLVTDLDVIAEVGGDESQADPRIKVLDVAWAKDAKDKEALKGQNIQVSNLDNLGKDQGWQGRGRYILPLQKVLQNGVQYEIAQIPPSPGFPKPPKAGPANQPGPPRIYRATPEAEEQLRDIEANR
jgi:hypothetical protein